VSICAASLDELIVHGLHALRETLQQDKELTIQNTSIGIVGPPTATGGLPTIGNAFRILEGPATDVHLKRLPAKEVLPGDANRAGAGDEDVQMAE
jgi:20S proteasome subunit alpha 6